METPPSSQHHVIIGSSEDQQAGRKLEGPRSSRLSISKTPEPTPPSPTARTSQAHHQEHKRKGRSCKENVGLGAAKSSPKPIQVPSDRADLIRQHGIPSSGSGTRPGYLGFSSSPPLSKAATVKDLRPRSPNFDSVSTRPTKHPRLEEPSSYDGDLENVLRVVSEDTFNICLETTAAAGFTALLVMLVARRRDLRTMILVGSAIQREEIGLAM
ncbi:hypothetical protein B0H15DRAFT_821788 [Mycena belliarum]|uniref:Uncharacterized protein n=1 Tax=Mycena belliarum TaxID=1033014 RepID=A0AAD6UCR3_9AGAR|nr:hypothetical protein B0H15DRAFT_821788 [Mycena belliae]